MEHVVIDEIRHLLPPAGPAVLARLAGPVLPAVDGKRPSVRRRRQIKRTPGSHRTDHLFEPRLVGGGADERLETDLDLVDIATGASRTPSQIRQHLLVDVLRRHHRMQPDAVGTLPRHRRHVRTDDGDMNRDVGVVDRTRIEQRHHQVERVVLALELEWRAILPAPPDRPHRTDVVTHPRCRSVPIQAETTLDVGAYLRAQPQHEPTLTELRQRPRRHRSCGRASGKRHRNRCSELDALGCRGTEGHHLEGVVLGLLDEHRIETDVLCDLRQPGEIPDVERGVGFTQPRIELAERKQRFDLHRRQP